MSTENIHMDKKLSSRLVYARNYAGLKQKDAAERVGISTVSLNRYEKGHRNPGTDLLVQLAELYKVPAGWLTAGDGVFTTSGKEKSNVSPAYERMLANSVPLISWVQAGDFADPHSQTTPGYAEEWIDTTATRSQQAFALTVHGDSMEPEFNEGDVIVVDPDRSPASGSYIIAKNGTEATFKQYMVDGANVFLKPLNSRYPIRDMTGIEFRIVGVVVEKRKRY